VTLANELQALFDEVSAGFAANDFDRVRPLWDADDPAPFYAAEEHETLVTSWPELEAYWAATRDINAGGCVARWTVAAAKPLGDAHAVAQFTLDWKIHVRGQPEPFGGFCRGLAVCRRTPAGWRFAAYTEAPLAPLTYLRKLYVRVGRDIA